jgi:hypothetical protein
MNFYLATSSIFPRSLRTRIFFLCFLATHVPLLAYIVWGVTTGEIGAHAFWLLLGATVVGTVIALLGIGALLAPIEKLADALDEDGEEGMHQLPQAQDLIQKLYNGVHRAKRSSDKAMRELDLVAHEDLLTGILNRRGFLKNSTPCRQASAMVVLPFSTLTISNRSMTRWAMTKAIAFCALWPSVCRSRPAGPILSRDGAARNS